MQAPKLPTMFSLFKQRRLKGFDYTPRYYDANEEARKERLERLRAQGRPVAEEERQLFRESIRHSWQREGSTQSSTARLFALLGLFVALAFAVFKAIRLLGPSSWGI